jgi:hypothetical protein
MNEEYLQGFIQKCAEAGVDPEALVKFAQGRGLGRAYSPQLAKETAAKAKETGKIEAGRETIRSIPFVGKKLMRAAPTSTPSPPRFPHIREEELGKRVVPISYQKGLGEGRRIVYKHESKLKPGENEAAILAEEEQSF